MTFDEIRVAHPFPWQYGVVQGRLESGMALVQVRDASGQEVPMFTVLDLTVMVTNARQPQPKTEAPAA